MADFVPVVRVDEIPDPGKQSVIVGERVVVLCHVGGTFYCIDDVCTHDGGPLGDGCLTGFQLSCPRHGARFDIRSGHALSMPATVATQAHEVKVEAGTVFVRLRDEGTAT